MGFTCSECGKVFVQKQSLSRHTREQHNTATFQCGVCRQVFKRAQPLLTHMESHLNPTKRRHQQVDDKKRPKKAKKDLFHPDPLQVDEEEITDMEGGAQNTYRNNWGAIRTHSSENGKSQRFYNFRWPSSSTTPPPWQDLLRGVFDRQKKKFKINTSHSFILRRHSDGKDADEEVDEKQRWRFFHASANNAKLFDEPTLINDADDMEKFIEKMENWDHLQFSQNQRPNSKYSVHCIAATSFYVNAIQDHPIGCADKPLPTWVMNNRGINILLHDENNGFPYEDNLCFFRCLALHKDASPHSLQTQTKHLFRVWRKTEVESNFTGVTLSDLPELEKLFDVKIDVFRPDSDTEMCFIPLHRSSGNSKNLMRLLCIDEHFCFINNFSVAAHSHRCTSCHKLWREEWSLKRHEQSCTSGGVKHCYPGGIYNPPPSVLEQLQLHGISVDPTFVFPYRAAFDFESYMDTSEPTASKKTTIHAVHRPMSFSIASNVPGYEGPTFFVSDGDPQKLLDSFVDRLEDISDASFRLLSEGTFQPIYQQLRDRAEKETKESYPPTKELKAMLTSYLKELPVFSFNGQKYDIPMTKIEFFRRVVLRSQESRGIGLDSEPNNDRHERDDDGKNTKPGSPFKFLVKDGNNYKCIVTEKLKFLDVRNYLAPGYCYSKYLQAYDIQIKKGFFPYEYVDSLQKLKDTCLPPQDAFYSQLKKKGISDDDYAFCQKVWTDHQFQTLGDMLRWYNNLDVEGFIQALEKQVLFYKDLKLDMSKDGLGVPGLCLRYLFKTLPRNVFFNSTHEKEKQLHQLMRSQMTGGLAIIFCRYAEKGLTTIRGQEGKFVQSLIGHDCNAMYLKSLSMEMPTGYPVIRLSTENFRKRVVDQFGLQCRQWLEWLAHSQQIDIRHKFNGREFQVGKRRYRVDGLDVANRTIYQFQGCAFHGHDCHINEGKTHNHHGFSLDELRERTRTISTYIRDELGYHLVEKFECEWRKERCENRLIDRFLQGNDLSSFRTAIHDDIDPNDVTTISKMVISEELFGFVQCDIETPEDMKAYFNEFQPIFKNVEVGRDDIGDHMRSYADQHKLLRQPRRTLVASYIGEKLLLYTPLLKWYLEHGLKIIRIYQIVEYQPRTCFQKFAARVTEARQEGDRNPANKIVPETMKLLGNSSYGKTITNLAKHRDVHYTSDNELSKLVNTPQFRTSTALDDDLFEVEMAKAKINWTLPNQIAFSVYQLSKLQILRFVYDCLDHFMDRSDYELMESDTDSIYWTCNGNSMEEVVKPHLRRQFYEDFHLWFPAEACDDHRLEFIRTKTEGEDPWVKLPCCETRNKLDQRKPGLFKEEYRGDGIVALCSKTYFCFGEAQGDKYASKGLNKSVNQLTRADFLRVLKTKHSAGGTNRGFKSLNNRVITYEQERASLSYLYIKRPVADDGISTGPFLR